MQLIGHGHKRARLIVKKCVFCCHVETDVPGAVGKLVWSFFVPLLVRKKSRRRKGVGCFVEGESCREPEIMGEIGRDCEREL